MRSAGNTKPATRRRAERTGCDCRLFRPRLSRGPSRRAYPLGDRVLVSLTSPHGPRVRDRDRERNQIEVLLEGWRDVLLVVEDEISVLVEWAPRGEIERAAGHPRAGAADRLHSLIFEELGPVPATLRVRTHDENRERPRGASRLAPLASLDGATGHAGCGVCSRALPAVIVTRAVLHGVPRIGS